jgi:CIC family chloride channel protein
VPRWLKPVIGGAALGALGLLLPQVLGIGYGWVQDALRPTAADAGKLLPTGWTGAAMLFGIALAKMVGTSLTVGSGGSGGVFAPSIVIGGLLGGAFGTAAHLVAPQLCPQPGAFVLVGMGAFYGGIAHVPLAALVIVCELCGSYDLLVPLMLAQGMAFIALRKRALYDAQVPTQRDSPVHRDALLIDVLRAIHVKDLMTQGRPFVTFEPKTSAAEMLQHVSDATWQDVFPVIEAGKMVGLVSTDATRVLAKEHDETPWALAADIMQPPVYVPPDDELRKDTERLVANGLRAVPVVDASDVVIAFLDEREVARIYLKAEQRVADSIRAPLDSGASERHP